MHHEAPTSQMQQAARVRPTLEGDVVVAVEALVDSTVCVSAWRLECAESASSSPPLASSSKLALSAASADACHSRSCSAFLWALHMRPPNTAGVAPRGCFSFFRTRAAGSCRPPRVVPPLQRQARTTPQRGRGNADERERERAGGSEREREREQARARRRLEAWARQRERDSHWRACARARRLRRARGRPRHCGRRIEAGGSSMCVATAPREGLPRPWWSRHRSPAPCRGLKPSVSLSHSRTALCRHLGLTLACVHVSRECGLGLCSERRLRACSARPWRPHV